MTLRAVVLTLTLCAAAAARTRVELSGAWVFAPDYPNAGVANGWHRPGIDEAGWDAVEVPHIWNLEPRYDYTGPAWYRKTFTAPSLKPGEQARLLFGAVFYKARVWLNGVDLGEHEGGYTAFELDTKGALKPGAENLLAVRVDNSWSAETIPGSRPGGQPRDLTYPWWNFGGIKKPVTLEIAPAVYVTNQKIAASPHLAERTASVQVRVWVRNTTGAEQRRTLRIRVRRPGAWDPAATAEASVRISPQATAETEVALRLPAPVALWDFDHPQLYESLVEMTDGSDRQQTRFGVRKLEIRDAKLLLNGEAVSFGGANRAADHPRFGSMETKAVIDQDLSMMKTANMGLARILHYPPSQTLLDWCDEHGFLVIAEAGNWGLLPEQMDSPKLRAVWQSQAREMVEQSWNHPSVIGWSVGNEY